MSDLQVKLGDITFADFEVPESITWGGEQSLSIKRLIGGRRVIDAMGADDDPIEWSGRFRGPDAAARARALDALRAAGQQVVLSWGEFSYNVVVAHFRGDFRRSYEIPYSVACVVVGAAPQAEAPGIDHMMQADNATAQALGDRIGDSTLTGLLGNLDTAISGVSRFASASSAAINGVLAPIEAVQSRVATLTAATANTLASVTTLGGVLPNNPLARIAATLTEQAVAAQSYSTLYELENVTGRMGANLTALGAGGAKVVAGGGDLFRLAASAYGDATDWTAIAKANGLTDPVITGVQTILVPPSPVSAGGVLA
jgi:hypothetical protein